MPKPSRYALIWSEEHQSYDLHLHGQLHQSFRLHNESAWLAWVQEQTTVAFHGQSGHLSLIKEVRPRGSSYWYAYRRQAGHTRKRYLGPSARLAFAHLEQIATVLTRSSSPPSLALVLRESLSWEQHSPLLSAKLSAPCLPNWLVERSRLLRELDAVYTSPLTLVSASAGSGKTTLLSAWAAAAQSVRVGEEKMEDKRSPHTVFAWLSLDEMDREPARFWTSVIAALRTALPTVGQTAFALLHSQEAPPLSTILTHLLGELEQIGQDIVLILDDYHVISESTPSGAMLFLLEHLPINMHLVFATRADPALPLSRWRMRGQLLEVRDQDLRFSQAEATNFLVQGMGLPLSEEEVAILETRTEGWVAGLQLAALSLRKREDRSTFVKEFAGTHRYLLDYVQQDILAQLPVPVQEFLVQTAILLRMNAALCQAVTASPSLQDSQHMLEELERANLFVVPLDDRRQWYRYHDLFREALLVRLQTSHPELIPLFHQRAANWYEAQGELREAITHALEAADYPSAARMMEQAAPHLWLSGEAQTILTWIIALPDAVLWQHALLALNALLFLLQALHMTSETSYGSMQARVEQTMARLEALLHWQEERAGMSEGEQARPCSELAVISRRLRLLRSLIETRAILLSGDKERLGEMIQELEELGLDEEIRWNMIGYSLRFWLVEVVQREGALFIPWLLKIKQHVLKAGDWLASTRVREWLAFAYLRAGKWHQVERECLAALALIEQRGERTMWAGYLYYFLSHAYYAWNRLDEAASAVQQVLRIAQDWQQVDLLIIGYLAFAQISIVGGNPTAADQALQQAEALTRQEHLAAHTHQVAGIQARCWLAVGNLEAASRWAERVVFSQATWNPNDKDALLTQIRVSLALRHSLRALDLLDHFREHLDRPGDMYTAMQYLAASVVALHQTGKQEQAQEILTRLLALTSPEDNLRVYLDLGEPMKHALKMLLSAPSNAPSDASSASFSTSYVVRLLASFEQEKSIAAEHTSTVGQPFALTQEIQPSQAEGLLFCREPLSPQERKVLQLLVTGRTYAEMAESLFVSLHTIKTQVSSIYRKLGVSRRAEAIAASQHFHLL